MQRLIKRLLFVALPTLVLIVYFGILATAMYISEARFSLRSSEGGGSSELLSLFGQTASGTGADAYVIRDYIESLALITELEEELQLRQHYQNPDADFFSRLSEDATQEEFVEYFLKQISIHYEQVSGILTLKVRAFTPEFAQQLAQAILVKSEVLVNQLRERAMEDSLALSRDEVTRAETRLANARQQLREFRQDNNMLDPVVQAGAVQGLIGELEGNAARVKAELAEARSYMREDSSRIISLKARIDALEQQVLIERVRLTGTDPATVSSLAAKFEALAVEHEFAQKQLLSAMTSLEAARIRAESQSRYLVAFVQPTLPEQSLWPRRGYAIVISFAGILMFYSLGSLLVAAVREHAGV